ncbi:purine catabolism regulator [Mumia flava]|uniref:Purine catabolism regulator n=1 Tax=Mumia flava TaxID=1348852 RepID=A0A0B2BI60_9ACTN|nr:PucR family transcriptional regulator [Mumia flava]PJJ58507.1 purine catabolism regulator [Mumia flava]
MAFTVQDLLDHPVMAPARPEVVVGDDLDRRPVRWVHTSEIYEISPLLRGGEVLLTTGLGLVGLSAAAMGQYVRALARQGVAALLLELGRTFPRAPRELREVAQQHGLPLILLHGVVPFIEVTETVHPLLLDAEVVALRRARDVSSRLERALAAGSATRDLLAEITDLLGAPAAVHSLDGDLIAGGDVGGAAAESFAVDVGSPAWARLVVGAPASPTTREDAVLCANAIAVSLAQASRGSQSAPQARGELLRDIAAGRYLSSSRIAERAAAVGFAVRSGARALGLCVHVTTLTTAGTGVAAITEAARDTLGPCLVADVDGEVLVAATVRPGDLRARLDELADAIDAELAATVGGSVVRLAAGPAVRDVAGLVRSLPGAREAAGLARGLGLGSRVVLASDLGVYRLLSAVVADPELERFIDEQLGALLEEDARQGADLMATLDAYLEAGLSKSGAARSLGIRRQTLYGRLERITRLLGGLDLDDRQRRTALDLALLSWRLRSSAGNRA